MLLIMIRIGRFLVKKESIAKISKMDRQIYGDVLRIELHDNPKKIVEYPDVNWLKETKTLDVDFNFNVKSESKRDLEAFLTQLEKEVK